MDASEPVPKTAYLVPDEPTGPYRHHHHFSDQHFYVVALRQHSGGFKELSFPAGAKLLVQRELPGLRKYVGMLADGQEGLVPVEACGGERMPVVPTE